MYIRSGDPKSKEITKISKGVKLKVQIPVYRRFSLTEIADKFRAFSLHWGAVFVCPLLAHLTLDHYISRSATDFKCFITHHAIQILFSAVLLNHAPQAILYAYICRNRKTKRKITRFTCWRYIDGLRQDCSISIANTLEKLQSCTKLIAKCL